MFFVYCWHRPGRSIHGEDLRACRYCNASIEPCICGPQKRSEPPCPCCEGSGWVARLLSKAETARQVLFLEAV